MLLLSGIESLLRDQSQGDGDGRMANAFSDAVKSLLPSNDTDSQAHEEYPVVLLATTRKKSEVSPDICTLMVHHVSNSHDVR